MPSLLARHVFAPTLGRQGGRIRRDGQTTDWWLIVVCDRDFGRYQRRLFAMATPGTPPISEPLWGAHVSVVRGEVPPNPSLWNVPDGSEVRLSYRQEPRESEGFIYLPVDCPSLLDYREALGLPRQPKWPLHLTIGNLHVSS